MDVGFPNLLRVTSVALALVLTAPAFAEELVIEEILVTATKQQVVCKMCRWQSPS